MLCGGETRVSCTFKHLPNNHCRRELSRRQKHSRNTKRLPCSGNSFVPLCLCGYSTTETQRHREELQNIDEDHGFKGHDGDCSDRSAVASRKRVSLGTVRSHDCGGGN